MVVVVRTMCCACMSVRTRTRMHLTYMDQRQRTGPFGWTDQPEPRDACSLRRQVPGVPSAKITQPQGEEKDCEARPPDSPLLRRKGSASFSISSALDALDPEREKTMHLDVSSWKARPLNNVTTIIRQMTRSNIPSFTTTISNLG